VDFAGQHFSTTANAQGEWKVVLKPMAANPIPQELVVKGKNELHRTDLLVGDVWLCSGQSNMAFALGGADAAADIQSATLPAVRYLNYWEQFASEEKKDVVGTEWHPMDPGTAPGCSAVAFYFARRVQKDTGIPIGILESTVGGTEIECWMPKEAFLDYPLNAPIYKQLTDAVERYRQSLPGKVEEVEAWVEAARRALANHQPLPEGPAFPKHPNVDRDHWVRIQSLFNGMIAPLTNFPIKGALWYQGENNGNEGSTYTEKMRAMIETWRKRWGTSFPFYYVQLANWLAPNEDPSGGPVGWQMCRMAQLEALKIPQTGMAVAVDVGDAQDIHPHDKADVGERLALWALAHDYGFRSLTYSGPLYRGIKIEGGKIRVSFDSVGSGLMVGEKSGRNPTKEAAGTALRRFAIAGADHKWFWADARIEGNTIVVSSRSVAHPVAVRYAFAMNPAGCNLYNREGLPASPFRSDDW
jgi:sialate O-acetylesterase